MTGKGFRLTTGKITTIQLSSRSYGHYVRRQHRNATIPFVDNPPIPNELFCDIFSILDKSFAGRPLMRSRVARSSSLRMAEENPALATFDTLEKEVAVPGGGFWFGSAGFWGEEDYRGFVDSYKPDNLINVSGRALGERKHLNLTLRFAALGERID